MLSFKYITVHMYKDNVHSLEDKDTPWDFVMFIFLGFNVLFSFLQVFSKEKVLFREKVEGSIRSECWVECFIQGEGWEEGLSREKVERKEKSREKGFIEREGWEEVFIEREY